MNRSSTLSLLLVTAVLCVVGDVWAKQQQPIKAFVSYTVAALIWIWLYHRGMAMGWGVLAYGLLSVVSGVALSSWVFHEPLTLRRAVALVLTFVALVLCE